MTKINLNYIEKYKEKFDKLTLEEKKVVVGNLAELFFQRRDGLISCIALNIPCFNGWSESNGVNLLFWFSEEVLKNNLK